MYLEVGSVLIFANGEVDDPAWIEPYLAGARAVIAADGGVRHLLPLGHLPDVLIGDLDSLPGGTAESMPEWNTEIIRHPAAKDETDLELALLLAVRRYPGAKLLVIGGFGGRLDHTLANVMLPAHPELRDSAIYFLDQFHAAWLITGESVIDGQPGDLVSLIPLGGSVRVAETTGLLWPLTGQALVFGPARGISNEMTASRATVRLEAGTLLCIHSWHDAPPA